MGKCSEEKSDLLKGRVLKARNSFYEVETEKGCITAKRRGKLKLSKREMPVSTGDIVLLERLHDGTGVIEKVMERKNFLLRPPIANVDQVLLIFAAKEPDINLRLVDRFLVLVESTGIYDIVLCINKADMLTKEVEHLLQRYMDIGYPVYYVSAETGIGVEQLMSYTQDKITVLAGPSGVGKSSLMNRLMPDIGRRTGAISERIKRGRHTTRFSELLPFFGGYLADTPGFSATDFSHLTGRELVQCFPDFIPFLNKCRYLDCMHTHEPACAIKEAVQTGTIYQSRYDSYLHILAEVSERRKEFK